MTQLVTGFDNASRQMKDLVEILRTLNGSGDAPIQRNLGSSQKMQFVEDDSDIKQPFKSKAFLNVPGRIEEDNEDYQMTSQNTSPDQRHVQNHIPQNRNRG